MDRFDLALSARCTLAVYRVMQAIGMSEEEDALIRHGCAAYERAHTLGYRAYKAGEQPGPLIESSPMLLKGWQDGLGDAHCAEVIENLPAFSQV